MGMAWAVKSIPHAGRTLSLTEGEANTGLCLPSNLIRAGNSPLAWTPWILAGSLRVRLCWVLRG